MPDYNFENNVRGIDCLIPIRNMVLTADVANLRALALAILCTIFRLFCFLMTEMFKKSSLIIHYCKSYYTFQLLLTGIVSVLPDEFTI